MENNIGILSQIFSLFYFDASPKVVFISKVVSIFEVVLIFKAVFIFKVVFILKVVLFSGCLHFCTVTKTALLVEVNPAILSLVI